MGKKKPPLMLSKSIREILEALHDGAIIKIDRYNLAWLGDRQIGGRYFLTENRLVTRLDKSKSISTKGNGYIITEKGLSLLREANLIKKKTKSTPRKKPIPISPKKCPNCNKLKSIDEFVDAQGVKNPRGRFCKQCREQQNQKMREKHFNGILSAEIDYIEKYQMIYDDDWQSKATPNTLRLVLFMERDYCPYCGESFKEYQERKDYFQCSEIYHIDHMDPLILGGEDSIRNVVCVCKKCNIKKGKISFLSWLDKLPNKYKDIARSVYTEKHGFPPEEFIEGAAQSESRASGCLGYIIC